MMELLGLDEKCVVQFYFLPTAWWPEWVYNPSAFLSICAKCCIIKSRLAAGTRRPAAFGNTINLVAIQPRLSNWKECY